MYIYTTTIDRYGMDEILTAMEKRINGLVKKHSPFYIVTTTEPLDRAFPSVMVNVFHLAMTKDVDIKDERARINFHAALIEALREIEKLNEACYVVVEPPKRANTTAAK